MPAEYIARPLSLARAEAAYALDIYDLTEMEPVFRTGDRAFANPDAPLRTPCEVVLRGADGDTALVRTLAGVTESHWIVRQWQPSETVEIEKVDWPHIHPIVGKFTR